ncbi:MAG TPA: hypothetical protein VJR29_11065 [bacterium]|nr:hypothetical protein [bacterium]
MNVYSVRLLPSLKIKLCQFLGIATSMAVEELGLRLESLERKLDRLDVQLRRSANRVLPVLEGRVGAKTVKKKPSLSRPARPVAAVTPPKKKRPELKPLPPPVEEGAGPSLSPAEVAAELAALQEAAPLRQPEALVLLQADENTRRSAAEHFGPEVKILEASELADLEVAFDTHQVLALFFDRAQLGQPEFRGTLEILAQAHPETRMIGLSSYLTLALADSLPQREDFATFLTRPLSAQALAEAFGGAKRQAIS